GKDTAYFGGAGSNGEGDLYEESTGKSIALQTDGKIVMTGTQFLGYNTWTSLPLVRYNPDGSLDSTFGNNGKVVIANDSFGYIVEKVALQQDGKILVCGHGGMEKEAICSCGLTLMENLIVYLEIMVQFSLLLMRLIPLLSQLHYSRMVKFYWQVE
ncbi:MAG: hypothetical protein LH473_00100, partial [Chitinophagales bacterium]|nr:hypothetical protein [Chitinophagales bacterium]